MGYSDLMSMFLGTILGGLISGFIGIFLDEWRRRNEAREKHFQDIKEHCLKPIREELLNLRSSFEFSEDKIRGPSYFEQLLKDDIHWWDYFSLRGEDEVLLDDLVNHFEKLASKLKEVEEKVKSSYPVYLKATYKLLKMIDVDPDFNKLKKAAKRPTMDRSLYYPYVAVFMVAIGYDKGRWPNVYKWFKSSKELDVIYEIGRRYSESDEAERIRSIEKDIHKHTDWCIRRIDEILRQQTKLKGKCKYI